MIAITELLWTCSDVVIEFKLNMNSQHSNSLINRSYYSFKYKMSNEGPLVMAAFPRSAVSAWDPEISPHHPIAGLSSYYSVGGGEGVSSGLPLAAVYLVPTQCLQIPPWFQLSQGVLFQAKCIGFYFHFFFKVWKLSFKKAKTNYYLRFQGNVFCVLLCG